MRRDHSIALFAVKSPAPVKLDACLSGDFAAARLSSAAV